MRTELIHVGSNGKVAEIGSKQKNLSNGKREVKMVGVFVEGVGCSLLGFSPSSRHSPSQPLLEG